MVHVQREKSLRVEASVASPPPPGVKFPANSAPNSPRCRRRSAGGRRHAGSAGGAGQADPPGRVAELLPQEPALPRFWGGVSAGVAPAVAVFFL